MRNRVGDDLEKVFDLLALDRKRKAKLPVREIQQQHAVLAGQRQHSQANRLGGELPDDLGRALGLGLEGAGGAGDHAPQVFHLGG